MRQNRIPVSYTHLVKFILEDEGPGIEDDVKSRIFDKFYQVDGSHKAEGNGLGLAPVSYTHLKLGLFNLMQTALWIMSK